MWFGILPFGFWICLSMNFSIRDAAASTRLMHCKDWDLVIWISFGFCHLDFGFAFLTPGSYFLTHPHLDPAIIADSHIQRAFIIHCGSSC